MARSKEQPENLTAYFRQLYQQNPEWLRVKSSQSLLDQYLRDHPGQEITQQIKTAVQNAKTAEKAKQGIRVNKKRGRPRKETVAVELDDDAVMVDISDPELEQLELLLDKCLTSARAMDERKMKKVISFLRAARKEVILRQGKN
jgi:hypothetical protein